MSADAGNALARLFFSRFPASLDTDQHADKQGRDEPQCGLVGAYELVGKLIHYGVPRYSNVHAARMVGCKATLRAMRMSVWGGLGILIWLADQGELRSTLY